MQCMAIISRELKTYNHNFKKYPPPPPKWKPRSKMQECMKNDEKEKIYNTYLGFNDQMRLKMGLEGEIWRNLVRGVERDRDI